MQLGFLSLHTGQFIVMTVTTIAAHLRRQMDLSPV